MQQTLTIQLAPEELKEMIRELLQDEFSKAASKKVVYMTRKEAADFLKISLPTLSTWSKANKIKAHQVGGRVLYVKSELETI